MLLYRHKYSGMLERKTRELKPWIQAGYELTVCIDKKPLAAGLFGLISVQTEIKRAIEIFPAVPLQKINFGVDLARQHDLLVVDIDTRECVSAELLPPTWKHRTPRGWHLFYRLPVSAKDGVTTIKALPYIDLFCAKGHAYASHQSPHILIPPSEGYREVYHPGPGKGPIPANALPYAPQWLVEQMDKEEAV